MKKKLITLAAIVCVGLTAFAHHGWNHALGIEAIRGLSYVVGGAVRPAPVVVTPTPVVTTIPVVTTPVGTTTPTYSYGYYNNVYCPYYDGYYYYNNAWIWGRPGYVHRPPPPVWRPSFHHRPPPPVHHGRGPGFHHVGPGHHGGPRPGGHHRR